jgi:hypothetical protein
MSCNFYKAIVRKYESTEVTRRIQFTQSTIIISNQLTVNDIVMKTLEKY